MSAFEFFFTFYSLLLGLTLSNVAVGFGRLWRLKRDVAVGWLTPVMAICLVEGVIGLWLGAWGSQIDDALLNGRTALLALGTTLPMIFVSVVLFPDDGEPIGSVDDHYMAHRRAIVGALAISSSTSLVTPLIVGFIPWGAQYLSYFLMVAPMVLIPLALLFIAHRRLHLAVLSALALYRAWWLLT